MFVSGRQCCEGSPSGDDMESDGNDRDGGDNNGPEIITSRGCHQAQAADSATFWSELRALCRCQDINDASNTLSSLQASDSLGSPLFIDLLTNHGQKGKIQLIFLCWKNSASFHLSFNAECSSYPIMNMTLHLNYNVSKKGGFYYFKDFHEL